MNSSARRDRTLTAIRANRLLATLRFANPTQVPNVAEALVEAGVKLIEVAAITPTATALVGELSKRFGERAFIGAGGITGLSDAEVMLDAGAVFLSTPIVSPMVVARARGTGAVAIVGAFTPTEVYSAFAAQADFVGLFPAAGLGPGYISMLRATFPRIPLIASGGLGLGEINQWLTSGAMAVTVGSKIIDREALARNDFAGLRATAAKFVEAAAQPKTPPEEEQWTESRMR